MTTTQVLASLPAPQPGVSKSGALAKVRTPPLATLNRSWSTLAALSPEVDDGVGEGRRPVRVGGRVGADGLLVLGRVGRGRVAVREDGRGLVGVGDRHGDRLGRRVGGARAVRGGDDDHVVLAAAVGGGRLVVGDAVGLEPELGVAVDLEEVGVGAAGDREGHGVAGVGVAWRAYPSPPEGAGAVRVLCLDGGGIRGLATIVMLERVMRAAGAWCVGECFDLIVGTSTGGVIALGAGLLRLTLKEVGELYDEMASEVFKPDGYYEFFRRGPGHAAARSFERVMGDMLGPEANQPLYAAAAHPRWYAAGCETRGEGSGCRAGGPPRVCLVSSLVSRNPATPFLLRSYRRRAAGDSTAHVGELPGEHRLGAVHALRATTAAPWYMEELTLQKELGLGRVTRRSDDAANAAATSPSEEDTDESDVERGAIPAERASRGTMEPADASRAEATLRCIDGAMACNNPTAVGIFEARRLFSRDRPLVVVSLGTGAGTPCEMETDSRDVGNIMNNIRNATCDVLQVAATVRHVLGEEDQYFRFQPTDEIFSCDLAESKEETRSELRAAAARYMNTDATVAEVAKLAALLRR